MSGWVLVKGWHDSGSIEGVYGPYSEGHARWLHEHFAQDGMHNWTLTECLNFEPADYRDAAPPGRDPASTTGGSATLATPPGPRHADRLPPRVPDRTHPFGIGKEIHG